MGTNQGITLLLKTLYRSLRNQVYLDLDPEECKDLRDSIDVLLDLRKQPKTWTGEAVTDISHHVFYSDLDTEPRERLLGWAMQLKGLNDE